MYNRYIPQPDGTYIRKYIPDPPRPMQPPPPPPEIPEAPPCEQPPPPPPPCHQTAKPAVRPGGLGSFFSQLLPTGFDTGDLIVVLLLLLMAADCQEEQNTALLTLALYLFL